MLENRQIESPINGKIHKHKNPQSAIVETDNQESTIGESKSQGSTAEKSKVPKSPEIKIVE